MAQKVFGIDLGTTYSCISYVDENGQPTVATNLNGMPTTPSVVMFNEDGSYVVGEEAKQSAAVAPERVVSLVKRQMGDPDWRFSVGEHKFSAAQVSSQILEALSQDAAAFSGETVEDVVITVPAYFGIPEREATRSAGEIAGLNVVDIINEPTAAAFSYGFARRESAADETVLVYDLGGGTFDVTVMEISDGNIRVVATDGDHELGGDNWDQRLVDIIVRKFMEEHSDADNPMFDPSALAEVRLEAEKAKRTLSATQSARARVSSGAHLGMIEVTRDEFETETRELLTQTLSLTQACIKAAADLGSPAIDRVLLVGGSSLMPAVAERLKSEFGFEPKLQDPHMAVAKGAALWGQKAGITAQIVEALKDQGHDVTAETLAEQVDQRELEKVAAQIAPEAGLGKETIVKMATTQASNVCSQGFGVALFDESRDESVVQFMIHRNDQLPAAFEDSYPTRFDNAPELDIGVWEQGTPEERPELDSNSEVVRGALGPLPPGYPRGTMVEIRFEMSNSGELTVTAAHPGHPEPLILKQATGQGATDEEVAQSREEMANFTRRI